MKKFFLSFLFAALGLMAFAQDYNKVTLLYQTKKYEDAKKEIDNLSANEKAKNKPETALWKAAVYAELYYDSTLSPKYPDAGNIAYDESMKYIQEDTSLKVLKTSNLLRPYVLLYQKSFNDGVEFFKKDKAAEAFAEFKKSEQIGSFIIKRGFSEQKTGIDTFRVLYAGYAAQNAKKTDSALYYYEKIADQKIGKKEFADVYRFLLDYYSKNKQKEKFDATLAFAKQNYPDQSALWNQFEMENMTSNASLKDIIAKYQTDDAGGKLTEDQYVSYANSFISPDKDQLATLDSAAQVDLKFKSADAFKKAFALKNNGLYAYTVGVLYYNVFDELSQRFYNLKGTSADLKAKRADVEKQQVSLADQSIEWLEQAYNILKAKENKERVEKTDLNRSVDFLATLYGWKREKSKGVAPKDYDKYDAKYTFYDGEHDKYKN